MPNADCPICGDIDASEWSGIATMYGQDALTRALLYRTADVCCYAAPGALMPLYLIFSPIQHLSRSLDLMIEDAQRFFRALMDFLNKIELTLPNRFWAFEHGGRNATTGGPGCVDHAHIHLIPDDSLFVPVLSDIQMELGVQGEKREFPWSFQTPENYLTLMSPERTWVLFDASSCESQYVRRLMSRRLRCPNQWNWQIYTHEANFMQTLVAIDRLKPLVA